jgi:DNA polymerase-3 subunit delta'
MPFADIHGQSSALQQIQRALRARRPPSGWLFSGPAHVGKGLTARLVAQALNCHTLAEDACGVCDVCRQIELGHFADYSVVEPAGQNIRMEQIQETIRWMQYRPERGHYRVLVLDGAERLNRESANAFLKTLEEPPPQTTILLLTSSPQQLLETILSRCQSVRFRPLERADVEAILAAQTDLGASERRWVAQQGLGSVRLDLAHQVEELRSQQQQWAQWMLRLSAEQMGEILQQTQELTASKDGAWERLLDWLETWFRDLAWMLHQLPQDQLLHGDQLAALQQCQQRFAPEVILGAYEEILRIRANIALNANKALQLESFWLRLKQQNFA